MLLLNTRGLPRHRLGLQADETAWAAAAPVCDQAQGSCWKILLYALVISSISQNTLNPAQ